MRVEQKIRDGQAKDARAADAEAKSFAEDVLSVMQSAKQMPPPFDYAETEAQRLAAVLTFLKTLVTESIVNEGSFQEDTHPRKILAHEALRMLNDITDGDSHPVHKFLAGIRKPGRPSSSLDLHKGAILVACVRRVRALEPGSPPTKSDVIRKMMRHPELSPYLENDNQVASMIGRTEDKLEAQGMIKEYSEALAEEGGDTATSVIARTAYLVGLRHKPLDMRAAMTRRPVNLAIYNPGAKHGEPWPEEISRWARGEISVGMKETSRGHWTLAIDGKPVDNFGSFLIIDGGKPASDALSGPDKAPDKP